MNKVKTYFCCMNSERWPQLKEVIENIYDHVDHIICIYGGGEEGDDTINGLSEMTYKHKEHGDVWQINKDGAVPIEKRKVYIINAPWEDNFPRQRQRYLDIVGAIREEDEDSWVIVSDSDEFFSPRLCKGMKALCEWADKHNFDCLTVRSKGQTYNEKNEVTQETYDDFWKPLIYKYDPTRKIIGTTPEGKPHNIHEGFSKLFTNVYKMPSKEEEGLDKELIYEHRKFYWEVWERGHRNFYAGGGGPNLGDMQPLWKPFQKLVDQCAEEDSFGVINTSMDYIKYLKKGNINNRLKSWFICRMFEGEKNKPEEYINYLKDNEFIITNDIEELLSPAEKKLGKTYDGSSEVREGYKYYFRYLHKDEEPKELKELYIG